MTVYRRSVRPPRRPKPSERQSYDATVAWVPGNDQTGLKLNTGHERCVVAAAIAHRPMMNWLGADFRSEAPPTDRPTDRVLRNKRCDRVALQSASSRTAAAAAVTVAAGYALLCHLSCSQNAMRLFAY